MSVILLSVPCTFPFQKPVYSTAVHKPSLQYSYTQNQFTVQLYTKPVYNTAVHKTSLQKYSKILTLLNLIVPKVSSSLETFEFS